MKEPSPSCPYFDDAISEIENARKINVDLRNWGHYWKEKYEDLEVSSEKTIESLKSEIEELEYRIKSFPS